MASCSICHDPDAESYLDDTPFPLCWPCSDSIDFDADDDGRLYASTVAMLINSPELAALAEREGNVDVTQYLEAVK